jgi:hypothetical protein
LPSGGTEIYLVFVSTSSLTPDDLRAAAEVHSELDPHYRDAVVESFLDKISGEIDTRVNARLAEAELDRPQRRRGAKDNTFALAVVSLVLGIPISAIMVGDGTHPVGLAGVVVAWLAIVAINVANALHNRAQQRGRQPR